VGRVSPLVEKVIFCDFLSPLQSLIRNNKKQGLKLTETDNLSILSKSNVLTKLVYALPMLFGYLTDHSIESGQEMTTA
jgi:hypothetical protein